MKRESLSGALTLGLALGVLTLASCSTTESRISKHPEIYQRLPARDQALVSEGHIRLGMSINAVWLAWGSPDQKVRGKMRGHQTETWIYVQYELVPYGPYGYPYYDLYGPGFGAVDVIATHRRHRGRVFVFFGDTIYDPFYYAYVPPSIPYPFKVVTFSKGGVVSFQYLAPP